MIFYDFYYGILVERIFLWFLWFFTCHICGNGFCSFFFQSLMVFMVFMIFMILNFLFIILTSFQEQFFQIIHFHDLSLWNLDSNWMIDDAMPSYFIIASIYLANASKNNVYYSSKVSWNVCALWALSPTNTDVSMWTSPLHPICGH